MKTLLPLAAVPPLLFLASACATPPPEPIDPICLGDSAFRYIETSPIVYRPGTTIHVSPIVRRGPMGPEALPLECTSRWTVTPPGLATLSADRRTLRIADDAPAGAEFTLSFLAGGESVAKRFRITGRDELVLTGRYGQTALEGCQASEPVREIEFGGDGRFSVTFTPFETYRDYWGTYRFDPATGAVAMTVDGGNYRPPGLDLEGTARFNPQGRLVLEGVYLGDRLGGAPLPGAAGCRYTF